MGPTVTYAAPPVTYAAPQPVIEYVQPAPQIIQQAPQIIQQAPQIIQQAPVTYAAPQMVQRPMVQSQSMIAVPQQQILQPLPVPAPVVEKVAPKKRAAKPTKKKQPKGCC